MTDSLHICFITKMYPPRTGGGATYAYELANALGERGHNVDVYTQAVPDGDDPPPTDSNVTVTRITKARPLVVISTAYFSIACRRRIDFDQYDVIHGTLMPASTCAFGPRFVESLDAPLVLTSHGTSYDEARSVDPQSPPDYLFRYVFHPINVVLDAVSGRFADRIVAVSDHTREQLRDLYRFDESKLVTVPPGIDTDRFGQTTGDHPSVSNDQTSILVLSRLDPRKGIDKAIRAFARLDDTDAELLIAGTGRLESSLKDLAEELGVREDVQFLGFVPDEELPELYASADLFVLPSEYEGFGIVFLEAMACGTPVVGTEVGGVPTAVDAGETGYLVERDDVAALADRMADLLLEPATYDAMAQSSVEWADAHDWHEIAGRVEAVYEGAIHG
ncbi:phosphatidylinositol alpha-1,6-mannosyltransferase [Halorientalis persicus]|uniref:Phosphatidylinositol alpha-1,6-mannosyltransferase n=1 Tax=Halorientalis persicus TaxID=1367881 RepID=A0A1H8SYQ7_9EURY|nr:glycosyltransferase family 4 protein [Halorientalis persicus]SEO83645.1 phosphatidylinositol alpha-1,6-mannosyltransferase [Halorientalis persicus]